jgi:hypothetical protein
MHTNIKIIPLNELELLVQKAEEYANRYDIPQEVYQSIHDEQEAYGNYLQENPDCYGNQKDWDQANVHNLYIRYVFMLRLSEIMESKRNIK